MKKRPIRELKRRLFSRVYVDIDHDPNNSIIIAGTGRSGTTWLADLVNWSNDFRLLFEPFHSRVTQRFGIEEGCSFLRPDGTYPAWDDFVSRVVSGRLRDRWADSHNRKLVPRRRLIKDITCMPFLYWLHRRYPQIPKVLLLRHPAPVALSRVRMGWRGNMNVYLQQDDLMEDHLSSFKSLMSKDWEPFERHLIEWCIHYLIPMRQFSEQELTLVFYESLVMDTEAVLKPLFAELDVVFDQKVIRLARRESITGAQFDNSITDRQKLESWRAHVTDRQIDHMKHILHEFGMDGLYSGEVMPMTTDPKVVFARGIR